MKIDDVFSNVMINEMARADLKGAGEKLKSGDWDILLIFGMAY